MTKLRLLQSRHLTSALDSVVFDPATLHARKKSGRGGFMLDDNGKGNLEMWRVMNRELVVVREEMRGMFFENNCYIIKYSSAKRQGVVYFWQVRLNSECCQNIHLNVIFLTLTIFFRERKRQH